MGKPAKLRKMRRIMQTLKETFLEELGGKEDRVDLNMIHCEGPEIIEAMSELILYKKEKINRENFGKVIYDSNSKISRTKSNSPKIETKTQTSHGV